MNVASLDNCKRLYELSGWDTGQPWNIILGLRPETYVPGYTAGYFLRKLPKSLPTHEYLMLDRSGINYEYWSAGYAAYGEHLEDWEKVADTPEDALCLLAIKLFEEGILSRELQEI